MKKVLSKEELKEFEERILAEKKERRSKEVVFKKHYDKRLACWVISYKDLSIEISSQLWSDHGSVVEIALQEFAKTAGVEFYRIE